MLAALAAALALTACGGGGKAASAPVTGTAVSIRDNGDTIGAFTPKTLRTTVGSDVTWTNDSSNPHNVDFDGTGAPKSSDTFDKGQRFVATFTHAGTFAYSCTIHPAMKGTVVVGSQP